MGNGHSTVSARNNTNHNLIIQCKNPDNNDNWGGEHVLAAGQQRDIYSFRPIIERVAHAEVHVEHRGRRRRVSRYGLFTGNGNIGENATNIMENNRVHLPGHNGHVTHHGPIGGYRAKSHQWNIDDLVHQINQEINQEEQNAHNQQAHDLYSQGIQAWNRGQSTSNLQERINHYRAALSLYERAASLNSNHSNARGYANDVRNRWLPEAERALTAQQQREHEQRERERNNRKIGKYDNNHDILFKEENSTVVFKFYNSNTPERGEFNYSEIRNEVFDIYQLNKNKLQNYRNNMAQLKSHMRNIDQGKTVKETRAERDSKKIQLQQRLSILLNDYNTLSRNNATTIQRYQTIIQNYNNILQCVQQHNERYKVTLNVSAYQHISEHAQIQINQIRQREREQQEREQNEQNIRNLQQQGDNLRTEALEIANSAAETNGDGVQQAYARAINKARQAGEKYQQALTLLNQDTRLSTTQRVPMQNLLNMADQLQHAMQQAQREQYVAARTGLDNLIAHETNSDIRILLEQQRDILNAFIELFDVIDDAHIQHEVHNHNNFNLNQNFFQQAENNNAEQRQLTRMI